jgi:hypothetical protein
MSLFKKWIPDAAKVAGDVLGGATGIVGNITGSKLINEAAEDVRRVTAQTGATVGKLGDGTVRLVQGKLEGDEAKAQAGLRDASQTVGQVAVGLGTGLVQLANNAAAVADGLIEGDHDRVKSAGRELIKTGIVASVGIGVLDLVGAVELGDVDADVSDVDADLAADLDDALEGDVDAASHPDAGHGAGLGEQQWVDPHFVQGYLRADGTPVEGYWRDGDGDTSTNLNPSQGGGYVRKG